MSNKKTATELLLEIKEIRAAFSSEESTLRRGSLKQDKVEFIKTFERSTKGIEGDEGSVYGLKVDVTASKIKVHMFVKILTSGWFPPDLEAILRDTPDNKYGKYLRRAFCKRMENSYELTSWRISVHEKDRPEYTFNCELTFSNNKVGSPSDLRNKKKLDREEIRLLKENKKGLPLKERGAIEAQLMVKKLKQTLDLRYFQAMSVDIRDPSIIYLSLYNTNRYNTDYFHASYLNRLLKGVVENLAPRGWVMSYGRKKAIMTHKSTGATVTFIPHSYEVHKDSPGEPYTYEGKLLKVDRDYKKFF